MRNMGWAGLVAAMVLAAGSADAAVIDFTTGSLAPSFYEEDNYFVQTVGADYNFVGIDWSPGAYSVDGPCALCAPTFVRVGNLGGFSSQPYSVTARSGVDGPSLLTVLARLQVGGTETLTFHLDGGGPQTFALDFHSVSDLLFSSDNGAVLSEVNLGQQTSVVPESATWMLMIAGFGLVGGALRRRRPGIVCA